MEILDALVQIMDLPEEKRDSLVQAIVGLCKGAGPSYPYHYVYMNKDIVENAAKAKEYLKYTYGEIPSWLYTSVNWGQAYDKLCKEGLLIQVPQGTLMRLRASKY